MSSSESGRRTFRSRLNEMVDQLREGIRSGKYKKGTYLPPEKTLAQQFKLSNKTVRKGLEQLITEGYIEKIPRVGSIVTSSGPETESGSRSAARAAVTLMLGCYSINERDLLLSRLLHDFQEQFPHIRVEVVAFHSDNRFLHTLQPGLDNGLIDLFTVKDRHFREIVEEGYTFALEPQPENGQLYSFLSEAFTEQNVLYARPLVFSPLILAYNLRHFREAGVMEPDAGWTWADAINEAARLSVPGRRHGLHFNVNMDERWPLFLLQSGIGQSSGKPKGGRGTGAKWLEGIRLSKSIIRNHAIFPDPLYSSDGDVGTLFIQGRTSMIVTGYEALNRFAASDLEYDISSLPCIDVPRTLLAVTAVAVNKQSKHKAEAQCLADYLWSPRAQQLIREHALSIPGLKPAAEAPLSGNHSMNRPSRYNLYRDIIPNFRRLDDLKLPYGAIRGLHETLKQYWTDLIDERTLCDEIDAIAGSPALRRVQAGAGG
ncbi:extracellular solute-binding protein [Paenibacillus hemerocallicola]|uniref:Extracellular solute-binding protein n=1 Tax=Paenibacillus hemerocallicola TaxID=1172614 RepID=A0A5C4T297_9BACL|nr:extracellular solute-binding protein [Paenibacillus hemerocallicola]TNJ63006.1 extracellular solute-binding protein [Paenibacillus hemerocallicola]